MNKKYLLLQLLLLLSVFVSLFIDGLLYFKILLVILIFLYGLLILPDFKYNREKYLFFAIGFLVIAILFLFVRYVKGTTYIVFLCCLLVLFMYLSRVLFFTTFGVVLESFKNYTKVKICDEFYDYNKIIDVRSFENYSKDSMVLISLSTSVFKKPIKILNKLDPYEDSCILSKKKESKNTKKPKSLLKPTKSLPKTTKSQKVSKKTINKKKK